MIISLTKTEYQFAVKIGKLRQAEAEKRNLTDKYGFKGKGEEIHIIGAAGELAVAKALKLDWKASVNTFKKISDLAKDLEVRTRTKINYDLIVRKDDADSRKYILVYQQDQYTYEVVGWISGFEAKKSEFLQRYGGRSPAYFIPRTKLQNLDSLNQDSKYSELALISYNLLKNAFINLGFLVEDDYNDQNNISMKIKKDKKRINFVIDGQTGETSII